jgi:hypothetical protein
VSRGPTFAVDWCSLSSFRSQFIASHKLKFLVTLKLELSRVGCGFNVSERLRSQSEKPEMRLRQSAFLDAPLFFTDECDFGKVEFGLQRQKRVAVDTLRVPQSIKRLTLLACCDKTQPAPLL